MVKRMEMEMEFEKMVADIDVDVDVDVDVVVVMVVRLDVVEEDELMAYSPKRTKIFYGSESRRLGRKVGCDVFIIMI